LNRGIADENNGSDNRKIVWDFFRILNLVELQEFEAGSHFLGS